MTIDALGKSNGIQNLKITNLHEHLLFDSMDPVDDNDDAATSLAGVQGDDTSLAGVPIGEWWCGNSFQKGDGLLGNFLLIDDMSHAGTL